MNSKRNVYLDMKSIEEARFCLFEQFNAYVTQIETIDVVSSKERVLAEAPVAALSSPNFHAAAMDGIAVAAESTFGAAETDPKNLLIGKDAHYINTGHVMPENTNAVIMIEHVNVLNDQQVEIEAPAFPWQNVRRMGEDIVATELVFARNHKITPYGLGALIAAGAPVSRRFTKSPPTRSAPVPPRHSAVTTRPSLIRGESAPNRRFCTAEL